MPATDQGPSGERSAWFATTHWSVVLSAKDPHTPGGAEALDRLCRSYWLPLYTFVRQTGAGPEDAQDLTQGFFADLLRRESLQTVSPDKGRFRSFLLVALKRFIANQHEHRHAQKRGGASVQISWDTDLAERQYQAGATADLPAERAFERRWALTVLDRVLAGLRSEWTEAGKSVEFDHLKGFLTHNGEAPNYAAAAAGLGVAEGAVRVAVHRLRRRFRELFRLEIGHTVARPEDIDDEIRYMLEVLAD
ncbi:MAG: sigma-70 family RNA polymerase sigma factor [Verrucomicrobiales bacterium]|nr:sigma-70 family RNA polymerase sigma factor [Verrucomicrobiales bacterium]